MSQERKYVAPKEKNSENQFISAINTFYGACLKVGAKNVNEWSVLALNRSVINRETYYKIKELVDKRFKVKNKKERVNITESDLNFIYSLTKKVYDSKRSVFHEKQIIKIPEGSFRKVGK